MRTHLTGDTLKAAFRAADTGLNMALQKDKALMCNPHMLALPLCCKAVLTFRSASRYIFMRTTVK